MIPPTRSSAREWLRQIVSAIRAADPNARLTVGLHMDDLENDRVLGPREASEVCDVLDARLPDLCRLGGRPDRRAAPAVPGRYHALLAGGRDVLFAEFGLPTYRSGDPVGEAVRRQNPGSLVEERPPRPTPNERSRRCSGQAAGAMLWCYTDYDQAIWADPPLDLAVHERSFGLWRADGSPLRRRR